MNSKANDPRPYWSQFAQFAVVGCAATALQYVVLVLLVQRFGVNAQYSSAIGFGCGAVLSYLLNRQWTFESTGPHGRLVVRFALMVAAGFCLNSALMYSGMRMLGLYYLFAQCIATAVTLAMNFLVSRIWVFRD